MTAELAVAVPAVLLVLAACLGGLRLGTERLRIVDAAATAARLAAVGEPPGPAASAAGAAVVVQRREGETVCVTLRRTVPLLGLAIPVAATSCALAGVPAALPGPSAADPAVRTGGSAADGPDRARGGGS